MGILFRGYSTILVLCHWPLKGTLPKSCGKYCRIVITNNASISSLGDPDINWEETVCLNLVLHQVTSESLCATISCFEIIKKIFESQGCFD